jgi:hypothetical protein
MLLAAISEMALLVARAADQDAVMTAGTVAVDELVQRLLR